MFVIMVRVIGLHKKTSLTVHIVSLWRTMNHAISLAPLFKTEELASQHFQLDKLLTDTVLHSYSFTVCLKNVTNLICKFLKVDKTNV
jgi:hypothetical protein